MESTGLVKYDEMCRAISTCYSVDEVKDIHDKVEGLRAYAKQARNIELERQCVEIRIRAERRAGEILKQDGPPPHRPAKESNGLTLTDLGISREQSSTWQKLAELPPEEFEERLAHQHMPSTRGMLRKPGTSKQQANSAQWVWSRLREMNKHDLSDPAAIAARLTPAQRSEVITAALEASKFFLSLSEWAQQYDHE